MILLYNSKPRFILGIDPSGSWEESKGTTGWCIWDVLKMEVEVHGVINAEDYGTAMQYYAAHVELIEKQRDRDILVVMEDFRLYASKAAAQINSTMETSQLLGVLKFTCWWNDINYRVQNASIVKARWNNDTLVYKGYLRKKGKGWTLPDKEYYLSRHTIDAIRHAVHCATFYKEKK